MMKMKKRKDISPLLGSLLMVGQGENNTLFSAIFLNVKLCFLGVFNSLNLIKKTKVYKNHHILQLVPMDNRQYGRNHYA